MDSMDPMDNEVRQEQTEEGSAFDLREYWRVVLKRKWTIISFLATVLAVVGLYSFLVRPTYTAKGTLLIEREPNILSFKEIFQIETFNDDYFQTQYKLLLSRSLAENTIDRLKLYENEKFIGRAKKGKNGGGWTEPISRGKVVDTFLGRLGVKPISMTRLVEVRFKDRDPKFAAEVLNALFDAYIGMNVEKKFQAAEQATEFLTGQIATIRDEIERDQRKLQEYGAEKNIIALSNTETTVVEKLGELSKAMTAAQIDKIQKETYYNEIRIASPDYIPEAINNPLIQRLREDYVRMSREYAKKQETFLPDFPEMKRLKTELEAAKIALENETGGLIKGAYSEYQAALRKYRALEAVFNRQKQDAIQLNSNAILYNSLKVEVADKKNLLESLMRRQSETGVSARLKDPMTSNIWIVDRAEPPAYPSSPKKKFNLLLALMIGLFGGLGLAFLFERLDSSIKSFEDVEKFVKLPSLGMVPSFSPDEAGHGHPYGKHREKKKGKKGEEAGTGGTGAEGAEGAGGDDKPRSIELVTHFAPKSTYSENYRSIRTTLLLSMPDSKLKAIVVTSALPREGKTATTSNLGVALAQAGKNVVIVDADLRKPRQHRIFKLKGRNGLVNYLAAGVALKDVIQATDIPKLYVVAAGPVPPNPVELLGSEKMAVMLDELKKVFDFVLIDTPPALAVSDAVVMGPHLDGAILVVRGGQTSRDALRSAREMLDRHKIRTVGVIINDVRVRDYDYYYMGRYYKYYGRPEA
jgi:capsular exopolysaccharide synthesis family protein